MRFTITIGDHEHDVALARKGDELEVEVDGQLLKVPTPQRGEDATTVTVGDATFTIKLEGDNVLVDGEPHPLGLRDLHAGDAPGAAGGKGGAVKPPMPGKIVAVKVAAGDEVEAGQVLVVLEAMKMQNEIPAPSAGVVKEVKVEEGQAVEVRDVLVVLE